MAPLLPLTDTQGLLSGASSTLQLRPAGAGEKPEEGSADGGDAQPYRAGIRVEVRVGPTQSIQEETTGSAGETLVLFVLLII